MATMPSRSIDLSIEIDAPFDSVWSALTDAKELANWFPLQARVTPPSLDDPRQRGSIWMSWGDGLQFETPIDVWEPFKRLRVIQHEPTSEGPMPNPNRVMVEYIIDARSPSKTVLRLIHCGFLAGSEADELYDATLRAWRFQLDGLKLYLEKYRGTDGGAARPRRAVFARCTSTGHSREELWRRVAGGGGLGGMKALDRLKAGERFHITLPDTVDGAIEGLVQYISAPREFRGAITNPGGGRLRLHVDDLFGQRDAYMWLSLFDVEDGVVKELQDAADAMMRRIGE